MKIKRIFYFAAAVILAWSIYGAYGIFVEKSSVSVISFSVGSQGERVREIQQRLKDYGFYDGSVDGIYGSQTAQAVRDFQNARGLTADGIVGNATLSALGINLGGRRDITDEEIEIIARAIYAEGRGEPYEGQVAIGAVILNRVESDDFPDTVYEVVYQKGAFDAVRDGQINLSPNELAYQAALDAANGWDPTGGALYYWNPQTATSAWIWSVPITTTIGRHVFGTK